MGDRCKIDDSYDEQDAACYISINMSGVANNIDITVVAIDQSFALTRLDVSIT